MDLFLYDRDLRHERGNFTVLLIKSKVDNMRHILHPFINNKIFKN